MRPYVEPDSDRPMRPYKVKDILTNLHRFHRAMAHFYQQVARGAEERKALACEQFSRIEQDIAESLLTFTQENKEGVLETWVRFKHPVAVPDLNVEEERHRPLDEESPLLQDKEAQLKELCEGMERADAGPSVRALFRDIRHMEYDRVRKRNLHIALDQDM